MYDINHHNVRNEVVKNINIVEEDTIKEAIDKVYDSVLLIDAYTISGGTSLGSGFIYKKDNKYGYILTNYHVVKDSNNINVITSNNDEYQALLLGYDEQLDLAILSIDVNLVPKVAILNSEGNLNIGDTVFTVGSPEGFEYQGTVTKGIISGLNRELKMNINDEEYIMNVIQTDAAINPGNSGGPLVNINGEVIGINSLKLVENEIEGMGFAIPIEEVLLYTDCLEQGKEIVRPYLGIDLINNMTGVKVTNVRYNAQIRDLKKDDIIISIDDVNIKDIVHFRYLLYKHEIGDKIKINYIRNLKEYTTYITLS